MKCTLLILAALAASVAAAREDDADYLSAKLTPPWVDTVSPASWPTPCPQRLGPAALSCGLCAPGRWPSLCARGCVRGAWGPGGDGLPLCLRLAALAAAPRP